MAERAGDVIDRIGMGHFQHKLLWACGASWATDAMEVLLIGFAIPSLIADWSLSPQPSARISSAWTLPLPLAFMPSPSPQPRSSSLCPGKKP
jgi:hypothetical protein